MSNSNTESIALIKKHLHNLPFPTQLMCLMHLEPELIPQLLLEIINREHPQHDSPIILYMDPSSKLLQELKTGGFTQIEGITQSDAPPSYYDLYILLPKHCVYINMAQLSFSNDNKHTAAVSVQFLFTLYTQTLLQHHDDPRVLLRLIHPKYINNIPYEYLAAHELVMRYSSQLYAKQNTPFPQPWMLHFLLLYFWKFIAEGWNQQNHALWYWASYTTQQPKQIKSDTVLAQVAYRGLYLAIQRYGGSTAEDNNRRIRFFKIAFTDSLAAIRINNIPSITAFLCLLYMEINEVQETIDGLIHSAIPDKLGTSTICDALTQMISTFDGFKFNPEYPELLQKLLGVLSPETQESIEEKLLEICAKMVVTDKKRQFNLIYSIMEYLVPSDMIKSVLRHSTLQQAIRHRDYALISVLWFTARNHGFSITPEQPTLDFELCGEIAQITKQKTSEFQQQVIDFLLSTQENPTLHE